MTKLLLPAVQYQNVRKIPRSKSTLFHVSCASSQSCDIKVVRTKVVRIFSIYDFCGEAAIKNKYRWFKVEGFGDG